MSCMRRRERTLQVILRWLLLPSAWKPFFLTVIALCVCARAPGECVRGRASREKGLSEQLPDRQPQLITMQQLNQPCCHERDAHARTHALAYRCTRTCKFYTWLHLLCRRKEREKRHIFNLHKNAPWLRTWRSGRRLVIAADGGDASKFHLLQISGSKGSTLIRGVRDPPGSAAALRDEIRNSEEVLFNAKNPLGFPTAVQQNTRRLCAVCHGRRPFANKHPPRLNYPPLQKKI